MLTKNILLFISILLTGLASGLLYSYACSVNPGLAKLGDKEYILSMQSINKAIVNFVFFISFMGALILLPITTWQYFSKPPTASFYLLLFATIIYIVGVFGVTAAGNIPLNNALATFNANTATLPEINAQRKLFEAPWNSYHLIRTITSIISFALTIIAAFKK